MTNKKPYEGFAHIDGEVEMAPVYEALPQREPTVRTMADILSRVRDRDPNGLDQHTPGAKLDGGKPPILEGFLHYFPVAAVLVAEVSLHGAKKYTWDGWKSVPNGIKRYGNAMLRHVVAETEGPVDHDSGLLHAAHAAWCALARLELIAREGEKENDYPHVTK